MHPLLDELRDLDVRANALWKLGVEDGRRGHEQAREEYKAIKEHLALRLKEFERREAAHLDLWISSTFSGTLRKAHIAMRSPTNTSPSNDRWRSSVYDLCHEIGYGLASLSKGLSQ
ncbi:hypothetical protein [Hydrogenophaga sp. ANAO-22]|jgi:hypothetical protein|uniref:hypothetical protein n=1 Tax=Hydrogenophaga sp. ANAO-22 TaxID=3166645 RepID=UPI0036D3F477